MRSFLPGFRLTGRLLAASLLAAAILLPALPAVTAAQDEPAPGQDETSPGGQDGAAPLEQREFPAGGRGEEPEDALRTGDDARHAEDLRIRRRLIADQKRVDRVAALLAEALPEGAGPDLRPYLGVRVADHDAGENRLLAEAIGLSDPGQPFVYSVDPTGPAAGVDVQVGDQLLAVAGDEIDQSGDFYKKTSKRDLPFPVRLRLLRDGREHEVEIGERRRPRGVEVLVSGDHKNVFAWTDRDQITVSMGMVGFLKDDGELAVVVGHEIGHLFKGHFSTSYRQGYQPYFSSDLEREADRFGLELAWRAGYDPASAVAAWERFEAELPRALDAPYLLSHPTGAQRMATARRIAAELEAGGAP